MATLAPFPGVFRITDRGPIVRAFKNALIRKGYKKISPNNVFGKNTEDALKAVQKKYRLSISGVYGPKTHNIIRHWLTPAETQVYIKYIEAQEAKRKLAVHNEYVSRIRQAGYVMIKNRASIHYTMGVMRMQGVRNHLHLPQYPHYEDCSSSCTWLFYQAGLPDPNGLNYNGRGFTGTLGNTGRVVPLSAARPGDLVLYGSQHPWHHVGCVLDGVGTQAHIFSHGTESGPKYNEILYRRDVGQVRRYF